MVKKPIDYQRLRVEMDQLITAIDLPELNKQFLRARWLEQITWMEEKALDALWWHRVLRLATIIGGVMVPALVSFNVSDDTAGLIKSLTFIVSLVVALSAAVEEFFRYGERWRHYRRTVESLKSEGWQFLQLSGPYLNLTHAQAYPAFATRVEDLSREEVDRYMTQVAKDKKDEDRIPSAP